jgi:hypothetical protein
VSDKHELEAIKVALEGYMEELYRRAITVAEDYYGFKNERNTKMDWSKKVRSNRGYGSLATTLR